jgi:ribosomal protein S18 acetylase RimI-like enzyme
VRIRDFDIGVDTDALRACVVELQDFERGLDQRMPAGRDIVDEYVPQMLDRCKMHHGKIIVAELDSEIAGYASVWTRVQSEELEDGYFEYGLVADLMVRAKFRNRGIGRRLLESAEEYARVCHVKWLRVGVLSTNGAARELYTSLGFSDNYIQLEKRLIAVDGDA